MIRSVVLRRRLTFDYNQVVRRKSVRAPVSPSVVARDRQGGRAKARGLRGKVPCTSAPANTRASRDDAFAHRIKNEFRNAVEIELLKDMGAMRFDGGQADVQ
jgi:hypothetical protein